ncbi:MAG: hypothetical protein Salg2KO_10940 [Salibacteraceae bacterium]
MNKLVTIIGIAITLVACGGSHVQKSSNKAAMTPTQKINIEIHGLSKKAQHGPRIFLSSKHDFELVWTMSKRSSNESDSVFREGAIKVSELIDSLEHSGFAHVKTTHIPSDSPDSVALILAYATPLY